MPHTLQDCYSGQCRRILTTAIKFAHPCQVGLCARVTAQDCRNPRSQARSPGPGCRAPQRGTALAQRASCHTSLQSNNIVLSATPLPPSKSQISILPRDIDDIRIYTASRPMFTWPARRVRACGAPRAPQTPPAASSYYHNPIIAKPFRKRAPTSRARMAHRAVHNGNQPLQSYSKVS